MTRYDTESNSFQNAVTQATDYISKTSRALSEQMTSYEQSVGQDKAEAASTGMRAAFEIAAGVIALKTSVQDQSQNYGRETALTEQSKNTGQQQRKDEGYSR